MSIALSVEPTGQFALSINGGSLKLAGGDYRVGKFTSASGTLVTVGGVRNASGKDENGMWQGPQLAWASSADASTVLMRTTFRQYAADPGLVVFEQYFPKELSFEPTNWTASFGGSCDYLAGGAAPTMATQAAGLRARTLFPAFSRSPGPADSLPCFAYHGIFAQLKACTVADYAETHQGGVPLVLYNRSAAALPMAVFSQLDWPKAQHVATDHATIGIGVKATVDHIPAGWAQRSILSAGVGIGAGMMAWGERMLAFSGKKRVDQRYRDTVHGTIGFWTDNGGYYHYATGSNATYEQVLPKVHAYHQSLGVRFRHWQFDSWFYPKDAGVAPGGGGGGVTNWTSMPSVFPSGMASIQAALGVPMVMHNRQWSPRSDYVASKRFKWLSGPHWTIPRDPEAFFTWFFEQQQGWGLSMYEQDWMCKQYDGTAALQTNISLADDWLRGMATGAEKSGRTVQYCMPYTHDILSAAAYPAVSNARATGDYFHTADGHQWAIGATALLYDALNLLPFKDGFYSSTAKQAGGQTVGPETHPDREALIATLSAAMVGPMDGIGLLNASRVNATCRADGYVLKPDAPLRTSDECFRSSEEPSACFVYHTHSDVKGLGRVYYLFSNDERALTPAMVGLDDGGVSGHVLVDWYAKTVEPLKASHALPPSYEDTRYALIVPVLAGGWVLLGELLDKFVPLSTLRFEQVTASASSLDLHVVGAAGEQIKVCVARAAALHAGMKCKTASFGPLGGWLLLRFGAAE